METDLLNLVSRGCFAVGLHAFWFSVKSLIRFYPDGGQNPIKILILPSFSIYTPTSTSLTQFPVHKTCTDVGITYVFNVNVDLQFKMRIHV